VSIAALDPEVKARTLVVNTCSEGLRDDRLADRLRAGPRELIRACGRPESGDVEPRERVVLP